jgi:hypothetical protein
MCLMAVAIARTMKAPITFIKSFCAGWTLI